MIWIIAILVPYYLLGLAATSPMFLWNIAYHRGAGRSILACAVLAWIYPLLYSRMLLRYRRRSNHPW